MKMKLFVAAAIGFAIGYSSPINIPGYGAGELAFAGFIAPAKAQNANRNAARRTARRTSRRVTRRNSVAGCSPYRTYYNCGGVYYQPVVENGVTVYVIVNP